RIITGKENVFGHPQVHRLMCFKAFVQLIMKKEHDSNSISAMEEIYKIVLQNNQACGIKPVLKMHNPKHYGAYIRELGSLRCFMTTTGENANQIHKKDNFNTRDVCYSLLINFVLKFQEYQPGNENIKFPEFTIIDTYEYKKFDQFTGQMKCKHFSHCSLYGMQIARDSCLKMSDGSYIVVDNIIGSLQNNFVFVAGKQCKDLEIDPTLHYYRFSVLGEQKLYPLNSIEQVIVYYTFNKFSYMIVHFDRYLLRNAKLD